MRLAEIRTGSWRWVARTLLWAVALAMAWYLIAPAYESVLAGFARPFLPEGIALSLNAHLFSIGLSFPTEVRLPSLQISAHNFGFGLVVTGAVVLGTQGRPWALRGAWLAAGWLLLFMAQGGLLAWAGAAYLSAVQEAAPALGARLFFHAVQPAVVLLPVILSVLWLVVYLGNVPTSAGHKPLKVPAPTL